MAATAQSLFDNLEVALAGAASANLATMATAAPIKSPEEIRAEWLRQRWGKFTASAFHRLMVEPKSGPGLSKGAQTYAKEKAVEKLTECQPDTYVSPAMQWGIDHELEAIKAFRAATGLSVEFTGENQKFLTLGADIGGTPDGLIAGLSVGVEVKCPNSATHLDYLSIQGAEDLKTIAPEYYWQCQGLMLISGADHWYFISYDPRFVSEDLRLHFASIERNDQDIDRLRQKLSLAIIYRDEIIRKVSGLAD